MCDVAYQLVSSNSSAALATLFNQLTSASVSAGYVVDASGNAVTAVPTSSASSDSAAVLVYLWGPLQLPRNASGAVLHCPLLDPPPKFEGASSGGGAAAAAGGAIVAIFLLGCAGGLLFYRRRKQQRHKRLSGGPAKKGQYRFAEGQGGGRGATSGSLRKMGSSRMSALMPEGGSPVRNPLMLAALRPSNAAAAASAGGMFSFFTAKKQEEEAATGTDARGSSNSILSDGSDPAYGDNHANRGSTGGGWRAPSGFDPSNIAASIGNLFSGGHNHHNPVSSSSAASAGGGGNLDTSFTSAASGIALDADGSFTVAANPLLARQAPHRPHAPVSSSLSASSHTHSSHGARKPSVDVPIDFGFTGSSSSSHHKRGSFSDSAGGGDEEGTHLNPMASAALAAAAAKKRAAAAAAAAERERQREEERQKEAAEREYERAVSLRRGEGPANSGGVVKAQVNTLGVADAGIDADELLRNYDPSAGEFARHPTSCCLRLLSGLRSVYSPIRQPAFFPF